jgi:hypothetical protein
VFRLALSSHHPPVGKFKEAVFLYPKGHKPPLLKMFPKPLTLVLFRGVACEEGLRPSFSILPPLLSGEEDTGGEVNKELLDILPLIDAVIPLRLAG